jgi:ABC-2 type transport system ATP-binding protein
MIELHGLRKQFGSLTAVDGIDLAVGQGEFFAFLGPNAAGKTTTIKMITGLLRPCAGRAMVMGIDVQENPLAAKALMSYVPDFPFLYEKLTPWEFLRFIAGIYEMDDLVAMQRSEDLFERFHLLSFARELIETLSHGTRQRVAICAALLHDPKVLVVDEPMVGLDPAHARIFKDELRRRASTGVTIFLSTHQLSVAEELADRIGIINNGRLLLAGTCSEICQRANTSTLEDAFLALIANEHASTVKESIGDGKGIPTTL